MSNVRDEFVNAAYDRVFVFIDRDNIDEEYEFAKQTILDLNSSPYPSAFRCSNGIKYSNYHYVIIPKRRPQVIPLSTSSYIYPTIIDKIKKFKI